HPRRAPTPRAEPQEPERPALVPERDGEQQLGVLAADAAAELHREAALLRPVPPALAQVVERVAQALGCVGLAHDAERALAPDPGDRRADALVRPGEGEAVAVQ